MALVASDNPNKDEKCIIHIHQRHEAFLPPSIVQPVASIANLYAYRIAVLASADLFRSSGFAFHYEQVHAGFEDVILSAADLPSSAWKETGEESKTSLRKSCHYIREKVLRENNPKIMGFVNTPFWSTRGNVFGNGDKHGSAVASFLDWDRHFPQEECSRVKHNSLGGGLQAQVREAIVCIQDLVVGPLESERQGLGLSINIVCDVSQLTKLPYYSFRAILFADCETAFFFVEMRSWLEEGSCGVCWRRILPLTLTGMDLPFTTFSPFLCQLRTRIVFPLQIKLRYIRYCLWFICFTRMEVITKNFTISLLPKAHDDLDIWDQIISNQKGLRLQSPQISPESFSSSYEKESQFTRNDWEARLQTPLASTFISSELKRGSTLDEVNIADVVQQPWLGSAVLVGPISSFADSSISECLTEDPETEERGPVLRFEICGLFVRPDSRQLGLGKALIEAAVLHGASLAREAGACKVCVRVSTALGNSNALELYKRVGFAMVNDAGKSPAAGQAVIMELWNDKRGRDLDVEIFRPGVKKTPGQGKAFKAISRRHSADLIYYHSITFGTATICKPSSAAMGGESKRKEIYIAWLLLADTADALLV
ncbi:uncharacterized protein BDR25DRAFT_392983 [Lindgomyces ingoldianus]|uniref:Uncharacterized protein n=1 Tax=Lindgomyces ingoldianus TaxID=673940 RepID=A0ACB6QYA6_9PLEO|nr:uncharacterized protein BDR25DRAFT_392983 [Lindgomyces ingoldianus]KAF2471973.1 hypothetical protein BDR25DRAFT_392983 [Lindgomyces ingoldianus]